MAGGGGRSALVLPFLVAVVWSCSSSSSDSNSGGDGGRGGDAGTTSGSGGTSGSSNGGAAGSGTSGDSGSAAGGDSGSGAGGDSGSMNGGVSGSGGAASGQSGSGGRAGSSSGGAGAGGNSGAGGQPTSCSMDDDCVVASVYTNTGCCSRGCGTALNGDYVENEPCATTDPMSDPVPASCNTGCTPCPQDPRCQTVYDAVCVSGTCTTVTINGPCSIDADCVWAIDYESQLGACCGCPTVSSRATLEHSSCIVLVTDPKPQGCEPTPADICAATSCPITCPSQMDLHCDAGHCRSG